MTDRRATEGVGAELGGILLPAVGVRALAVALVLVVLAVPWLASWTGLLARSGRDAELPPPQVVRLRPELVRLPGGRFTMGSPESEAGRSGDESQHEVEVGAFSMCRTEVTNAQWKAVMGAPPGDCSLGCEDDHPVHGVSWVMSLDYLNRLTERENELLPPEGRRTRCYEKSGEAWTWVPGCTGYRLPTEAEWEYAARAGTETAFSFGDDPKALCEHGNVADLAARRGHPDWSVSFADCDDGTADLAAVGNYAANPWGLFDVHGNVSEWVWDAEDARVKKEGPEGGAAPVLRGGSFRGAPLTQGSARRSMIETADASEREGLRCAQGSVEPASGTLFAAATELRPALVHIHGGEFVMGSPPDEKDRNVDEPQHRVRVSSFVMCETEVTQAQFKAVRGVLPEGCPGGCGEALPANGISWLDAVDYLDALSAREGLRPCHDGRKGEEVAWDLACDGYRLPTEAEWEYAARAGTTTAFSFGDSDAKPDAFAWYTANTSTEAKEVRTREPNEWKLYDMHGNVWEWVWDVFDTNYGGDVTQVTNDPRGPPRSDGDRVLRGGSFARGPRDLRSAYRDREGPTFRYGVFGFRCVRAARPQP